jgi:hypothetical protein
VWAANAYNTINKHCLLFIVYVLETDAGTQIR